jgi:hypothetical protein
MERRSRFDMVNRSMFGNDERYYSGATDTERIPLCRLRLTAGWLRLIDEVVPFYEY